MDATLNGGGMKIYINISNFIFIIFLVATCFLISFRSENYFYDVRNYISMFNDVVQGYAPNAEITYYFISKVCNFFGMNHIGLFFIYSMISIYCKFYFLKKEIKNRTLIVIFYLLSFFILYEFVQMRVSTSFGLFLVFLHLFLDRKIKLSLIFLVSALSFHYSIFIYVIPLAIYFMAFGLRGVGTFIMYLYCMLTIVISCYNLLNLLIRMPSLIEIFSSSAMLGVIPERLYQGYIENVTINTVPSTKMLFTSFMSLLASVFLFLGIINTRKIYLFSAVSVMFGSWIYLIAGCFGVVADRLAELCILFVIPFIDGVIERRYWLGILVYIILMSIFSYNIFFRSTYFSILGGI
ncbi:EpsG family protein [Vibrio fluvialis]|uniref:EpsG family protein n=1 Tax=Vibrio fluvialis TaxID=676 RepID=UPI000A87E799|nr:EpsG family protein [Vibrio fluvialis]MBY7796427.1 EpsG family protein [Vibrio fluvialis]MBY7839015.1 EpsG family protein [Vibrio fluvialis]MBY8023002.1 EpsG family protein [Vibrio fluvialis]MBY8057478.1 EpsG family protein [Vibrio fluvialis]MBY8150823.1 EpsG family protein [Vibrio fluvialis]